MDSDVGGVKEVEAVEVPVEVAAKTKIRNGAHMTVQLFATCLHTEISYLKGSCD